MKLFDLHCDTLTEAYLKNESLLHNTCHIDIERAGAAFEDYTQVFAVWSEHALEEDECYDRCFKILDYADREFSKCEITPIYAVEGAKLLNGDIRRLEALKKRNVKILTLVWKDVCCIGGAYNNDLGLTEFGEDTVEYCLSNGITPDLSHSNDIICKKTLEISKSYRMPVIASHSCSRQVYDHPRNVSDKIATGIALCGGVIGINFVSEHLGGRDIDRLLKHIDHLTNICGADALCLGGDFDGMSDEMLPEGIKNVSDLPLLYDAISKKYHSEAFAEAIFYSNAQNFSKHYLF